jgi:hypothetical protein
MKAFYQAVPYVLILAQAIFPAMLARRYAISPSVKSKWTLALLAALPIPTLLAGFALFAFIDVVAGRQAGCEVDACESDAAAFITLMVSALVLYLFGIFNALLGYRSRMAALTGRKPE